MSLYGCEGIGVTTVGGEYIYYKADKVFDLCGHLFPFSSDEMQVAQMATPTRDHARSGDD